MNSARAKWIRELVTDEDPSLLLSVRQYFGEKTKEMDDVAIYKAAKKLWEKNIPEKKKWGKWIKENLK